MPPNENQCKIWLTIFESKVCEIHFAYKNVYCTIFIKQFHYCTCPMILHDGIYPNSFLEVAMLFLVGWKSTYVNLLYMDDHDCILIIIKYLKKWWVLTTKRNSFYTIIPYTLIAVLICFEASQYKNYFFQLFFSVSIFYHYHFGRFLLTWNVKVPVT